MPNKKWKRPKNAGKLFLARDIKGNAKVDTEGVHPICRKCPLKDVCTNVQYDAKGTYFWCADNPNEREK